MPHSPPDSPKVLAAAAVAAGSVATGSLLPLSPEPLIVETPPTEDDDRPPRRSFPWLRRLKGRLSNIHRPGLAPDIFIFSTPRSGSTLLMELLQAQPGMKICNEPLSLRRPGTRETLRVSSWEDLERLTDRENAYFRYFTRLRTNRMPEMNRPFYWRTGRFFTRRTVFKVLHGGEDMIPWFATAFNADIVLLIRHPIPTVLSHSRFPRLPFLLQRPEVRERFTPAQVALAERIVAGSESFARGVVDWCLQNALMLADRDPRWPLVSYEDLTLHPQAVVRFLEPRLHLKPVGDVDRFIRRPSRSTVQSDPATRAFFAAGKTGETTPGPGSGPDRMFLIEKWRRRVDSATEHRVIDLCRAFGIDVYEPGNPFPIDAYRLPGTIPARVNPCSG